MGEGCVAGHDEVKGSVGLTRLQSQGRPEHQEPPVEDNPIVCDLAEEGLNLLQAVCCALEGERERGGVLY